MKIYFCDVCNESIPLKDINSNRITIEDGKIICPKCAPKTVRKRESMPGGVLGFLGVVVVGIAALGVFGAMRMGGLADRIASLKDDYSRIEGQLGQTRKDQTAAASTLRVMRGELDGLAADVKELSGPGRESLKNADDESRRNLARLTERIEALKSALDESLAACEARMVGGLKDLRTQASANANRLSSLESSTENRIRDLKDLVRGSMPVAGPGPAPVKGGSPAGGPAAAEDKEITELIAQLSDPNDGVRFAAVADLGNYTGERVVVALEKMLEDPADFVRKMSIRNLKKLKSKRSVPLMIKALRDEDLYVRKAAQDALKDLTGQDFGFDAEASAGQRESRVKQWERWWAANKAKVLG